MADEIEEEQARKAAAAHPMMQGNLCVIRAVPIVSHEVILHAPCFLTSTSLFLLQCSSIPASRRHGVGAAGGGGRGTQAKPRRRSGGKSRGFATGSRGVEGLATDERGPR
eukprot:580439-Rhodomonas_salina.3